ncbi:F-box/kelch-repeat protein At3g06240-like [Papaver somniferum]|uniref:F-box/kelch-repeat protein At3g06240-like n=1 Tax=Papaver somniferum TaxID=3469 RepID=UPI000E701B69|nr:F-box/kelch-repeat protein At3g06240-like [Papaver somniferum]
MEKFHTDNVENILEKLHTDNMENILCRLPVETALQAKRVCKTWRFLLRKKTDKVGLLFFFSYKNANDAHLWYGDQLKYNFSLDKMHNGNLVLNFEFTEIMLGSCNGLVCFRTGYPNLESNFLICNPLTGEVFYAPKPNKYIDPSWGPVAKSGFGYCQSTNEYKIVRIHSETKEYHVQVYTVGGGEWRSKDSINFQEITYKESILTSPLHSVGIYANGAIHWLHLRYRGPKYKECRHDCAIVAFDLEDENFQFLTLPRLEDVKYRTFPGPNLLGPKLLGGKNLYFVDTFYDQHCTDIWAYKRTSTNTTNGCDMRENYNDKNSWHWIKEFSIEWEEQYWKYLQFFDLLSITRNDELLLRCFMTLYRYDLKTSTWNEFYDADGLGCKMINVIPHANSLVSLKDLAEGQDRQYPLDDSRVHGKYS